MNKIADSLKDLKDKKQMVCDYYLTFKANLQSARQTLVYMLSLSEMC